MQSLFFLSLSIQYSSKDALRKNYGTWQQQRHFVLKYRQCKNL